MNEIEQAATDRYRAAVAGLTKHDADIIVARSNLEKLLQARPTVVGEVYGAATSLLTVLGGSAPPDIFKQVMLTPPVNRELKNLKVEEK